ncbi:MAG TPA: hypothetical protein VK455_06765 [Thermoplasmata archaeon]|nr:hypothetical protein [Thermoplasmata archaeon]
MPKPDVSLGHSMVRVRQDPSVVVGDRDDERTPLPTTQGET